MLRLPAFALLTVTFRRLQAGLLACLFVASVPAGASGAAPTPGAAPDAAAPAVPAARPSSARVAAPTRPASSARSATRPAWSDLRADQQRALAPLAAAWSGLSEAQKRKWLALSGNFDRMNADERTTLHSRMADWVALSPQQRMQARLNFGEAQSLSPGDKKAKWEAYQALPPEEKRRLAAGAQSRTPPTAAAVRPVPSQRLANVPPVGADARSPRIASAPPPGGDPLAAPAPAVPQN